MKKNTKRITVILMPDEFEGVQKAGWKHKLNQIMTKTSCIWVGSVEVPRKYLKKF